VDGGWSVSEGQVPVRAGASAVEAAKPEGLFRTLGKLWGRLRKSS